MPDLFTYLVCFPSPQKIPELAHLIRALWDWLLNDLRVPTGLCNAYRGGGSQESWVSHQVVGLDDWSAGLIFHGRPPWGHFTRRNTWHTALIFSAEPREHWYLSQYKMSLRTFSLGILLDLHPVCMWAQMIERNNMWPRLCCLSSDGRSLVTFRLPPNTLPGLIHHFHLLEGDTCMQT